MENKRKVISEYHLHQETHSKIQFEIQTLSDLVHNCSEDITRPHIHSFYQIIWFKTGKGKHYVDFNEYEVSDNTIFFIAKNQVHAFDDQSNYEGYVIHFSESFIVQKENDIDFFLKCNIFNNPHQLPSCCVGSENERQLEEYILQMQEEVQGTEEFGSEELLRLYLKAFLIKVQRRKSELEELHQSTTPFLVDEKRVQLIDFVNLVEENYRKGLTVAAYAEMLSISIRTLSNLTRQQLNKKPSQIIQERIVLEAKRLLLHSDLNINQIADELGFEDFSYFTKYFKKHTKQSPSSFRKSIQ